MAASVTLEVFRYDPETDKSWVQDFDVEYQDDWVILDALNHIKDHIDGSLTYRWSCRMGVCGSCGMTVNGYPKLTCSAFIRDYLPGPIRVEPPGEFRGGKGSHRRFRWVSGEVEEGHSLARA